MIKYRVRFYESLFGFYTEVVTDNLEDCLSNFRDYHIGSIKMFNVL